MRSSLAPVLNQARHWIFL